MKIQTREEMIQFGASPEEANKAVRLFEILRAGLRINERGLVETCYGDKTPLGLYRTIRGFLGKEAV